MSLDRELQQALKEEQVESALALLEAGAKPSQKAFEQAARLAEVELLRAFYRPKARLKAGPALAELLLPSRRVPAGQAPPGNWSRVNGLFMVPQPEERILACTRFLLEKGADLNAVGELGTPLMQAASQGLVEVVRLLLQAGADANIQVGDSTALSLAVLFQFRAVEEILRGVSAADATPVAKPPERVAGPPLPRPRLPQTPEFLEAVAELERLLGAGFQTKDELCGGVEFAIPSAGVNTLELQRRYRSRGAFVFESQRRDKFLVVLPTRDWSAALAVMHTSAGNYGMSSGDIASWMKNLETTQPFELEHISHSTLSGRFLTPIADPARLAEEMYRFCPDIVDQGCGSVARLARELDKPNARLFFWWD